MDRATLLLVDADREVRHRLAPILVADGYAVVGVPTEAALPRAIRAADPKLILLGDLPGDGANARIVTALRSGAVTGLPNDTPVFVISDTGDARAMLACYAAGADDFRRKSISHPELRARTKAILQRTTRKPVLRIGALSIDQQQQTVTVRAKPLPLSRMEFALLAALAEDPFQVKPKADLLRDVWGYHRASKTRTVDAHACRLRGKLADAGINGWVVSCRGVGYRLIDAPTDDATA